MNIVKALMSNVTEFQMPPGTGESISSMWFGQKEYYLPSCPFTSLLEVVQYGESHHDQYDLRKEDRITHCTFIPCKEADMLHSLKCTGILPNVKVKEEYRNTVRICYKEYAYFDTIKSIEMMYGNHPITTFISKVLLLNSQFGVTDLNREQYEFLVGNRPELLEWNEELPLSKIKFTIPFTFCKHPKVAIPLFLHASKPVQFHLEFRSGLERIIRMQKLNDDTWEDIPFDGQYIERETVPRPELSAKYFNLTPDEKLKYMQDLVQVEHIQEVSDFIELTDNELFSNQKTILLKDETPTKTIFWFAQRESAEELNETNFLDNNGNEPSRRSLIIMGEQEKEPYVVIDKVEDVYQHMNHSVGNPKLGGFHLYHFGPDQSKVFSIGMPISVQMKDLNMKLKYLINEEDRKKKRVKDEEEVEYKLYAFLEVSKRICYEVPDKSNTDKIQVHITVEDTSGEYMRDALAKFQ